MSELLRRRSYLLREITITNYQITMLDDDVQREESLILKLRAEGDDISIPYVEIEIAKIKARQAKLRDWIKPLQSEVATINPAIIKAFGDGLHEYLRLEMFSGVNSGTKLEPMPRYALGLPSWYIIRPQMQSMHAFTIDEMPSPVISTNERVEVKIYSIADESRRVWRMSYVDFIDTLFYENGRQRI